MQNKESSNLHNSLDNNSLKNNTRKNKYFTSKNKKIKYVCSKNPTDRKSKKHIPKKIKEQVWLNQNGNTFKSKCYTRWCTNKVNVFNYHVGHNIPESKGGTTDLSNLIPICDRCNLSMSNNYTIDSWDKLYEDSSIRYLFLKKILSIFLILLLLFTIGVIILILLY